MASPEEAQKFETELVWCLEQLHLSMQTRKLNEKQGEDFLFTIKEMIFVGSVYRLQISNTQQGVTCS